METPDEPLARQDAVTVRMLADVEDARKAVGLLDGAERAGGGPRVDEAERHRLQILASRGERHATWHPVVAWRGSEAVGYAGVLFPADPGGTASGDVAVPPGLAPVTSVLPALLEALTRLSRRHEASRVVVWMRHVTPADLDIAAASGFGLERRLGILGRALAADDEPATAAPDVDRDTGSRIRAYAPGRDDEALVEVLAAAYRATAEAGWDLEEFRQRRSLPWFREEDLLVAQDETTGRLLGLVWVKRRSRDVGEIYNLAVHPDAQGARLGPRLLAAGLEHLRSLPVERVMLWVDLANERAVRLYRGQGFATLWEDVALRRDVATTTPGS